jgi:hypothetical protein
MDMDAEMKLWIRGVAEPLTFQLNRDASINDMLPGAL